MSLSVFAQNDGGGYNENTAHVYKAGFVEDGNEAAKSWALRAMSQVKRQRDRHDVTSGNKRPKTDITTNFMANETAVIRFDAGAYKEGWQKYLYPNNVAWVHKEFQADNNIGRRLYRFASLQLLNYLLEVSARYDQSLQILGSTADLRSNNKPNKGSNTSLSIWPEDPTEEGSEILVSNYERESPNRKILYCVSSGNENKAYMFRDKYRFVGVINNFMDEPEGYAKNPKDRMLGVTVFGRQKTPNVFSPHPMVGDYLYFITKNVPNSRDSLLSVAGLAVGTRTDKPKEFLQVMGANLECNGSPFYFSATFLNHAARRGDLRYVEENVKYVRTAAQYVDTETGEPLTYEERLEMEPHRWTLIDNTDERYDYSKNTAAQVRSSGAYYVDTARCGVFNVVGRVLTSAQTRVTPWPEIENAHRDINIYNSLSTVTVSTRW